jgi:hypothetical protein
MDFRRIAPRNPAFAMLFPTLHHLMCCWLMGCWLLGFGPLAGSQEADRVSLLP